MCLYPKLIKNRKYTSTKKNGGVIPAISDIRVMAVPVGCGKCIECVKKKTREWQVRLLEDIRHNKNGIFVTLTYSDESIKELKKAIDEERGYEVKGYEADNEIARIGVRRFLERWRKTYKKSLRHWLVTELGHEGTENVHMHGIIWTDKGIEEVRKHWKYGYIWPRRQEDVERNYVSERTVNYITKYIGKMDEKHKEYKPKVLTSAGIGNGYINREDAEKNKYKEGETKETYSTRTGHQIALNVYWRNKIYTEEEREKLWLEKLDKGERWICGERVEIKESEEEYYELLVYYRGQNKRLGYGDNTEDWNRKKYEEERRNMLMQKRVERTDAQESGPIPFGGFKKTSTE